MLRSFRYLLFPFSLLYGAAVWVRNRLFDANILKSSSFNFPLICVGNLAAGGTGKTPMTEYLVRLLRDDFKIATLSRGYKRKTTGFAIANEQTTALEIGDEPMQFHQKFPELVVAVGEERLVAIPQLLHERPDTDLIILDDAFQHRQVLAGLNILLTDYSDLYTRDLMLPAGNLRDVRSSSRRADIIVVTKCPANLSETEKTSIIREIAPTGKQQVFFTSIVYGKPYHLFDRQPLELTPEYAVLLVCGIANPAPLKKYLTDTVHTYDMLRYADHHIFHSNDLRDIKQQFEKLKAGRKIVLTTEKDGVRLEKFSAELQNFPIYAIPVEHVFLFGEEDAFRSRVLAFIKSFRQAGN